MVAASINVFLALLLCVWLGGVLVYVLHATRSLTHSATASLTHSHTGHFDNLHEWRPVERVSERVAQQGGLTSEEVSERVSEAVRKGARGSEAVSEAVSERVSEGVEEEVLREVLREAEEHPVQKGERDEWRSREGVGRREDLGRRKGLRGHREDRDTHTHTHSHKEESRDRVVSRGPGVTVTCDTRGNLGPCTVINQVAPGTDWIKDRWQAASDMGGTAIPGSHWVEFDLHARHYFTTVTLDWETAYATAYRIEGSNSLSEGSNSLSEGSSSLSEGSDGREWTVLYDGTVPKEEEIDGQRTSHEYGQSPGVKTKLPLHVVHTVQLQMSRPATKGLGLVQSQAARSSFRFLRVFIVKPGRGWGVSLWQVDVSGVPA